MATINGAHALGLRGKAGELRHNAFADLIVLPCPEKSADAYDSAVHHSGNVLASMIAGDWAIVPK